MLLRPGLKYLLEYIYRKMHVMIDKRVTWKNAQR